MKRTKLKTWVKVAIIIIIDIVVYKLCGNYGYLAVENNFACMLIVLGWCWLFFGQFAIACVTCPELDI